ncbi:hypothetical protein GCM10011415_04300 [Salipiger pallidus]|uniref:Yip1 domain-containing protein n=1 Tax=Salipiger pallidus TaxID=1775170 RepID=A0A8J2ZGI0_9RHOB|nr:YIP1 family protein [Salipiger pallidus]GGG61361.1 hypothetical protein GCM10011415_04300 [Salipiger pallidus]
MTISRDIVATWTGPRRVVSRIYSEGPREDRALMILMAACGLFFIAAMPALAREAHLDGADLNPRLGGALLGWLVMAPLLAYLVSLVGMLWGVVTRRRTTGYGARLALFWAMLASSPLVLLNGLVSGLIGAGPALTLVGGAWFAAFLWFWLSGLAAVTEPRAERAA